MAMKDNVGNMVGTDGYRGESCPEQGSPAVVNGKQSVAAAQGSHGEAVLDQKALEGLRALEMSGSPGLLGRFIGMYVANARDLLETLHAAAAQTDVKSLHMAAHSLKSTSATLGATRLSGLCKELELQARRGSVDNPGALVEAIAGEYERTRRALEQELRRSA
jgi:HPt (histidine-containing phosphotransfer) domain-containing protein